MSTTIIHNALIVNEGEKFHGYVVIEDELIESIGRGDAPAQLLNKATSIHDAEGAYLLPGCIDDQVHFRDPGLTHKADMETESRAAVAGGVTSFMDMPNTIPQTITLEALEAKHQRAAEVSVANYSFYIGATNDNIDTLLACDYSKVPGVKLFLGASTGNMLVDNNESLNRIFGEVPALIAIHSEDEEIIRQNKESMMAKMYPLKSILTSEALKHAISLRKKRWKWLVGIMHVFISFTYLQQKRCRCFQMNLLKTKKSPPKCVHTIYGGQPKITPHLALA